jgi:ferrochelatase
MDRYDALLLVSFGGPERAQDVMPFLRRVTAGRGIPEGRLAQVAQHYYDAGGASPVNAHCRALLGALRSELAGLDMALYWGNRNWPPMLEATVAQMRDDGVRRALAFVTSPYGGYSSCRQYLDDIALARTAAGPGAPEIDKLRLYYNHPGWVGPWVTSLRRALATAGQAPGEQCAGGTEVLFSAHSIPQAMAATSPYAQQVLEAARLVAEGAGLPPDRWRLAWQSRSGAPGSAWLEPDICDAVRACGAATIVVVPVGFVSDNMEVVHDLDVEAAAAAERNGARFVRAETVIADPTFVAMVRELVQERLGPDVPRLALGNDGPWPGTCPPGHCPPPARRS